jgi:hypothetical protein
VKDPENFYRSGALFCKWMLHFLSREGKQKQKKTPVSRVSCALSNRPMTRRLVPPCGVARLDRVLTIRRLLRASLHLTPCLPVRCLRHRQVEAAGARGNSPAFAKASADSNRSTRFIPSAPPMLGAGQWEI